MLNRSKFPLPKTSETCEMLRKGIESSIESVDPFRQADANIKLEMLRQSRCKKVLLWIHENYKNNPSPFAQQFKKALDYAKSI
ncbi:MAG: hypothetical protein QXX08_11000 [Candidatus Bathyarchaeia archaeon]